MTDTEYPWNKPFPSWLEPAPLPPVKPPEDDCLCQQCAKVVPRSEASWVPGQGNVCRECLTLIRIGPTPRQPKEVPKMPLMKATWTKLRSGDFGIRIIGMKPTPGFSLSVTSKAGKTKLVTVAEVIWSGKDRTTGSQVHLCAITKNGGENE